MLYFYTRKKINICQMVKRPNIKCKKLINAVYDEELLNHSGQEDHQRVICLEFYSSIKQYFQSF